MGSGFQDALKGPDGKAIWHELICHTDTPSTVVDGLRAMLQLDRGRLNISVVVDCAPSRLAMPVLAKPYRTDGLWQTTCFELFYRRAEGGYIEYNFSPSSQWAAYMFDGYRVGMAQFDTNQFPPNSTFIDETDYLYATIDLAAPDTLPTSLSLSAVIEETDGTKSYWALRHPPGPPDFHHPDCFALTLEAPPPA